MSYEGTDEYLYWMRWDEGFDGTAYRAEDLERGERGESRESRLYTSSDRKAHELERLKDAEEGHASPLRK